MVDLTAAAPHLYGVLLHPGDDKTEPFPLASPLAGLQTSTMPKGMAEDIAQRNGLPSTNFALIWLEAAVHLVEQVCEVTLVSNDELADLKAAAAVKERRRNEMLTFTTPCGAELRAMARGFDTGRVSVPCELVNHECGAR